MKNKILISILVMVLAVAMIAAATMAWFNDEDNAGDATFTAGILSIEAGSSAVYSHYFNPDENIYLYGAKQKDNGDPVSGLYEINMTTGDAHMFYEFVPGGNDYSPNALAFDKVNKRLYFTIIGGSNSTLWFYDFSSKKLVQASETNELKGLVYGASFWNNCFWYIKNGSDDLYAVSLNPDGTVDNVEKEKYLGISGENNYNFSFGDFVFDIKDGTVYGSTSNSGTKAFFTYKIGVSGSFNAITTEKDAINLQLAFGSDGVLYGHNTSTKKWYVVTPGESSVQTEEITKTMPNIIFTDLASGYISVWNPGNTDKMKYTVTNTGNKTARIRAKLDGSWSDEELSSSNVEISICDDTDCDGTNWFIGKDGYFYYNEILQPGDSVELCLNIHLSGPDTDDEYQGQTFKLNCTMYAIQTTNNAPEENDWEALKD